jgi:SAM-dependent methyltransferase
MDKTSPIEYWNLSDSANLGAMKANDARAKFESNLAPEGDLLTRVHAEALRDYKDLAQLVLGGAAFLRHLKIPFAGDAADLGSGTGVGATMISKIPETQKVYAVEYSEQFVKNIMPIVFSHFQADENKIVRVVGDFNNLKLPDHSLSLLLEIDAFHHSENLERTLKECYRILKPGGVVLSVDRAWPDSYSREELDRKLEVEYSDDRKALF